MVEAKGSLQPVAQMDRADFVLVGPASPAVAHGDQRDALRRPAEHSAHRRIGCDKGGGVKPFRFRGRRDNARVPALVRWMMVLQLKSTDRISIGEFSEVETIRRTAANLAHANLSEVRIPQCKRPLHAADHDNAAPAVGKRHGRGRERSEHIDDCDGSFCPTGAW
ncbi:MAG TPA: hypothetical protein VMU69_19575 [Bradyrhizobium sp.]|nr:hypothetical protein [Bradyrhizobium sp.]